MKLKDYYQLKKEEKEKLLFACCGSTAWVKGMLTVPKVDHLEEFIDYAEEEWYDCNTADWLEAFENHARLGESNGHIDEDSPRFAKKEQMALLSSDPKQIKELLELNTTYEDDFGYLFISYAKGKTAEILIDELKDRINNDPRDEIKIAADEQNKITKRRLKKVFSEEKMG